MPPLPPIDPKAVFLNIPYDEEFRSLYVAYVVGLYQIGLVPHVIYGPGVLRELCLLASRLTELIRKVKSRS